MTRSCVSALLFSAVASRRCLLALLLGTASWRCFSALLLGSPLLLRVPPAAFAAVLACLLETASFSLRFKFSSFGIQLMMWKLVDFHEMHRIVATATRYRLCWPCFTPRLEVYIFVMFLMCVFGNYCKTMHTSTNLYSKRYL